MASCKMLRRIFLRKILYRIDFQLITEKLQEELFEYAVNQYSEYFSHQDSIQERVPVMAIDEESDASVEPRMNSKEQKVFVLSEPKRETNDGRNLRIGKTFICLELNLNTESMNIAYSEWLADIINHMQDNPVFRPMRVGLRKYNLFYILDKHKENINDIFKINFFSEVFSPDFTLHQFENMQVYDSEDYRLNFSKKYSTGKLSNDTVDNELAHLISFDFDLYSNEPHVLEMFVKEPSEAVTMMNTNIFNFFKEIIQEDVLEKIQAGDSLEEYCVIPF